MNTPRITAQQEFDTLRNEINQGKKYVFERLILMITASGLALFELVDKSYAPYLPFVIIALLFFNLWFTANRLESMARIISYIQLVLENKESNWFGWETSLRYYRVWKNEYAEEVDGLKKEVKNNRKAIYDNLGFYPAIYYIHVVSAVMVACGSALYLYINMGSVAILATVLSWILLIGFLFYVKNVRPNNDMLPLIEINRKIWEKVLKFDWKNYEIKKTEPNKNV